MSLAVLMGNGALDDSAMLLFAGREVGRGALEVAGDCCC